MYENRHMLPSPTAEPTAARMKPRRVPQASRGAGAGAGTGAVMGEEGTLFPHARHAPWRLVETLRSGDEPAEQDPACHAPFGGVGDVIVGDGAREPEHVDDQGAGAGTFDESSQPLARHERRPPADRSFKVQRWST